MNKRNFNSNSLLDVQFKPNVKGYDPDQVDSTLDEVIEDYKEFESEIEEFKEYVKKLETLTGQQKKQISELQVELTKLQNRLDKIGNIEGVTQDNLQLIMRIRALEKFLWEKGHNPEKIK